ncbi:RNA-binding protein 25 [Aplysia californica]|uniref:RNA-binding protein 25 n=1 Tax=Aplysia californica TaxID=6500 RepID=A0ABM0JYP7_APLCA|nr:RNA-binding protein 25 [Aplysia californica]XP_005104664.1 RNA-binding protein 25 [Aplysia californica]XP_005104666.1 RNA-binding protein 25 [Aplysia californica]XP_012941483.1 RNA-binding protein 25 [Aplysia californica]
MTVSAAATMATAITLFLLVAVSLLSPEVDGAKFLFGGEARRVCEAYKLICPTKKVCALQSIEWPRAMKFPVCVHEKHLIVKSSICRRAPQPGKCGARFVRWYFNVHMGACSWFTYSGCGGNSNNFRTAEECETRCMTSEDDTTTSGLPSRLNGINTILVEDEASQPAEEDDVEEEYRRQPKLIPAPARAAEIIDLDDDITASLQTDRREEDLGIKRALRKERRRQRRLKKERKRRRRRNKKKRKNRISPSAAYSKSREVTTDTAESRDPDRSLTPLELGPNFESGKKNLAEASGRGTTHAEFAPEQRDLFQREWLMDRRFRRQRRRRRRRRRRRQPHPTSAFSSTTKGDLSPPKVGAHQDTYYDKVHLFDILEKPPQDQPQDT